MQGEPSRLPLRGGVLIQDQSEGTPPVGELMRQPRVQDSGGTVKRLDEFLGQSFNIVGRKPQDLVLGLEAAGVLERLGGKVLALDSFQVVEGEMDRLFDAHPAAVLRPDRYIYGVVDEAWDLDRLMIELGRKLGLS